MMFPQSRDLRVGVALGALLVAPLMGGCDLPSENRPSNARVVLEGGGGEFIQLIVSNDYELVPDEDAGILEAVPVVADTFQVAAPYQGNFSLGPKSQFYVKAAHPDGLEESVTMIVYLDSRERYNWSSKLGDEVLVFAYR